MEYQASREAFGKFSDAGHRGHQLLCAGGLDVARPRASESFSFKLYMLTTMTMIFRGLQTDC